MEIKNLTKEQKVELLNKLLNDLTVVVTGCYACHDTLSGDAYISDEEKNYFITKGEVLIHTSICSG